MIFEVSHFQRMFVEHMPMLLYACMFHVEQPQLGIHNLNLPAPPLLKISTLHCTKRDKHSKQTILHQKFAVDNGVKLAASNTIT